MERFPDDTDSIEEEAEWLSKLAAPGDLTPIRFIGMKRTLRGWKSTYQPEGLYDEKLHRARYLKYWSEAAKRFFLDLPKTNWDCLFEVGSNELLGHKLQPCSDGYALFETLTIPPRQVYSLDYASINQVPADAAEHDLPDGEHSDSHQLYVGNIRKQIALSFQQFSNSLLDDGDLTLKPKELRPSNGFSWLDAGRLSVRGTLFPEHDSKRGRSQ